MPTATGGPFPPGAELGRSCFLVSVGEICEETISQSTYGTPRAGCAIVIQGETCEPV